MRRIDPLYLILIKKDFMNNYPIDKLPLNQFKILIPTICDLIGSTSVFFGLTQIVASIVQMTRGLVVVFTALVSYFYLGRLFFRHHLIAIFLIVLGIILVGLSSGVN